MAEEDEESPFFQREYSEFYYTKTVYDHYIHPQWDEIGSPTLYVKVLFADYEAEFAILELIGEWNDCISNDVMFLKRELIDFMIESGIRKFILIGENILNFHYNGDDYYEEWFNDTDDGWIVALNFHEHVLNEFRLYNIDSYFSFGGELDTYNWRTLEPGELFSHIDRIMSRRLSIG